MTQHLAWGIQSYDTEYDVLQPVKNIVIEHKYSITNDFAKTNMNEYRLTQEPSITHKTSNADNKPCRISDIHYIIHTQLARMPLEDNPDQSRVL